MSNKISQNTVISKTQKYIQKNNCENEFKHKAFQILPYITSKLFAKSYFHNRLPILKTYAITLIIINSFCRYIKI